MAEKTWKLEGQNKKGNQWSREMPYTIFCLQTACLDLPNLTPAWTLPQSRSVVACRLGAGVVQQEGGITREDKQTVGDKVLNVATGFRG